jgi:hypothetical protein
MLTKRDGYCRAHDRCQSNSDRAITPEIAAIWSSIADSWRFLIEREDRLTAEERERDGFDVDA